jgi:RNA polymerase sigma-70 factor (ECF subfamily)
MRRRKANDQIKADIRFNMDERQTVNKILSGDEPTLRYFYRHFQPSLLTYIRNKIANEADAEEIMQDTFLATIEGFRDFSFRCRLFTFLCSIANHKIIDFYRKKKIKSIFFSHLAEFEPLVSTLLGPEEKLDEELLRQKIAQTFERLTPRYRQILRLKYIYGFSVGEIAYKLSISFKSAESQLFRARRAFATAFAL